MPIPTTDTVKRYFDAVLQAPPRMWLCIRVDDFYEFYGATAVQMAEVTGKRLQGHREFDGRRVELMGLPFHSVNWHEDGTACHTRIYEDFDDTERLKAQGYVIREFKDAKPKKPRTMIDASERNARRLRAAGLEPNEFHLP